MGKKYKYCAVASHLLFINGRGRENDEHVSSAYYVHGTVNSSKLTVENWKMEQGLITQKHKTKFYDRLIKVCIIQTFI